MKIARLLPNISRFVNMPVQKELGKKIMDEINNEFEFLPIQKELNKNNFSLYVFGGFIRDVYYNGKWNDLDIRVVTELPLKKEIAKFRTAIKNFGKITEEIPLNQKRNCYLIRLFPYRARKDKKIDFVLGNTYDLLNDFSIHAIYFNIEKHYFIDKYEGLKDLKNKIIRTYTFPKKLFELNEGLLHFRTIKTACLTNFKIDKDTYSSLISTTHLVINLFHRLKNSNGSVRIFLLHDIFDGYNYNPKLYSELLLKSGIFKEMITYLRDEI